MYTTAAFIPVRGGSKSIPKKNIKLLAGKPLVYWTLRAASDCPEIDSIIVSTDDEEIGRTVESFALAKVKVVPRSPETATDTASTESALLEFAETCSYERIVLIQATSPLLSAADLSGGLKVFAESKADSLLSTVEQKRFTWVEGKDGDMQPTNYDPTHRPRRQEFDGYLVENGAFYIMYREGLVRSKNRLHGRIKTWTMDPSTFVEIDEPDDWDLVEHALLKRDRRKSESAIQIPRIKIVLTDVDGVLTDAGMYYAESGDELKKFNTRDGKAFELLRNAGIRTGIITSENTQLVARRAAKLKLDYLYQGAVEKLPAFWEILERSGITAAETAYIGDDLADIPLLQLVGLAVCPSDASATVLTLPRVIRCPLKGGAGVLRWVAERILET